MAEMTLKGEMLGWLIATEIWKWPLCSLPRRISNHVEEKRAPASYIHSLLLAQMCENIGHYYCGMKDRKRPLELGKK